MIVLKTIPSSIFEIQKTRTLIYKGALYKQLGDKWYFDQFEKKISFPKGCISVEYIEDEQSPKALYELNPDIKIIVSLRQPADRALSAYQWYVRKALIPNMPVEEGILQAIKHYNGEIVNDFTPAYRNIIERGFYEKRLKNWYLVFPSDQIKIIFYDEVKQDPLGVIKNINELLKYRYVICSV
jgi:hypothetical protein